MAGFFCCYCGADETNPCDCFSKKDEQVSESTGPKTWGDVIQFGPDDSNGEIPEFAGTQTRVEWVAYVISRRGMDAAIEETCLSKESLRIVLRWLLADRPPLTDAIPPEADEPVARVVRWEPTEEDMDAIRDRYLQWNDDQWDSQALMDVIKDAIRDCQRDLPEVEPPTPPTDRIAEIEARIVEVEVRVRETEQGFATVKNLSDRLAALESRNATPTPTSTEVHMSESMTFAAFSLMNRTRSESPNGFDHNLNSWSLSDWFTATMGELGEAANIAKKLNRVRDGIPGNKETEAELRAMLAKEFADVFIYLDLMAQSQGLDLAEIAVAKFRETSAKIGYVAPEPRDAVAVSVDGWQTEPPTESCRCRIETNYGRTLETIWDADDRTANDQMGGIWFPRQIKRYWPTPPNPIGKSAHNTPTTFEQALTVEPPATPEPEIPLPNGCTEIAGFPLLCLSRKGNVRPRSRECFFLTWSDGHAAWMKACGCSQDEIKQAARYAIEQIARDAGLDVVVK